MLILYDYDDWVNNKSKYEYLLEIHSIFKGFVRIRIIVHVFHFLLELLLFVFIQL
jgi:hypothetical protein